MTWPSGKENVFGLGSPAATATVFVGRARELGALRARCVAASAGNGGVALIAGEPGVGKTRIAQELAAFAREQGTSVLWGRCYEGDWAPPYGPWVESLGDYARDADVDDLRRTIGALAPPIAQLVPEVRDRIPETPPPAPLGPEEERFRLHDAVSQFLLIMTRSRPAVLVLDDLHWADGASLALLCHLARFLATSRLLVVGTYRAHAATPGQPLSNAIAALLREPGFGRLQLTGLSQAEVSDLISRVAPQLARPELARLIHSETDGNPFFVGEVLRHLIEEGRLGPEAAVWAGLTTLAELGIPEGVRQVVGRRLARLSPETNRLLGHAAFFTGGFDFRVLQALTDLPEETLLDCLDEALAAQLFTVVAGKNETYDFVHALVRHTIADAWSPSRRVRLHRQAAEALAQAHAGREIEYAAELAVQYHASAALPGAANGIPYALAAAERARTTYAREQAVTFLRMARDLAAEGEVESRASILCRLAVAEAEALLLDDAQRSVGQALGALGDANEPPETVAGFLATVAAALKDSGARASVWQPLVERGLSLVPDDLHLTWARLTLLLEHYEPVSRGTVNASRWRSQNPRAVAIARTEGDENDYARTLQPFEGRTRAETEAIMALATAWQHPPAIIRAYIVCGFDWLYDYGDFRETIRHFSGQLAVSERYGSIPGQAEALVRIAIAQIALGDLVTARETVTRAAALVNRLGPEHRLHGSARWMEAFLTEYTGGDWAPIAAFWTRFVGSPTAAASAIVLDDAALAALAQTRLGNPAEARRLLDTLTSVLDRVEPTLALVNGAIAIAGTAVWTLRAADLAKAYRRMALDLIAAGRGDYPLCSNELTVARMAALLGNLDEAESFFASARTVVDASGQRPLRAIVDYEEAQVRIDAGESASERLAPLIEDAVGTFRSLGMDGWTARAETLRDQHLHAGIRPRSAAPAGLTAREIGVLQLVARGVSDREIGERLFLSPRTVNAHVRNMLNKTMLANRTELSVWAVEHDLVSPEVEK